MQRAARLVANEPRLASKASGLRYVSLPRLEKEIARRQAAHCRLIRRCSHSRGSAREVCVRRIPSRAISCSPDRRVIGRLTTDGRIVSKETHEPVVRLDDLLVLFRRGPNAANSHFGCSINPRQEALAKTQAFLASSSQEAARAGAAQAVAERFARYGRPAGHRNLRHRSGEPRGAACWSRPTIT